jgi:phosphoribosylcarboxyaminoimidazole (NCAIR) mutase
MDGALPSIVAGLATVPVIGLPTSVGYGHGGNGEAALSAMLQSGAPGLCVVNIDNGIGAGCVAGMIAHRAVHARASREPVAPARRTRASVRTPGTRSSTRRPPARPPRRAS